MPATDCLIWGEDNLWPVGPSAFLWGVWPNFDYADHFVSTKALVREDVDLQVSSIDINICNAKLKWFVEVYNLKVLFVAAPPLAVSSSLVKQVHFHIGLWKWSIIVSWEWTSLHQYHTSISKNSRLAYVCKYNAYLHWACNVYYESEFARISRREGVGQTERKGESKPGSYLGGSSSRRDVTKISS